MSDIIEQLKQLPKYKERTCDCGEVVRTHALQIYSKCPKCGSKVKQRAFGGIGTEIYDVIDAVLEWAGTGDDLQEVLKRHTDIHKSTNKLK